MEQQESDRSWISYVYAIGRAGTCPRRVGSSAHRAAGRPPADGHRRPPHGAGLLRPGRRLQRGGHEGAAGGPDGAGEDRADAPRRRRGRLRRRRRCCPCGWPRCIWTMPGCGRCWTSADAEFDALLSRLEGHAEVGVKVYADARAAAAAEAPAAAAGASGSPRPAARPPPRPRSAPAGPTCSSAGPNGVRIVMPTARRAPSPPMCGSGWPTWPGTGSRTARSRVNWRPVRGREHRQRGLSGAHGPHRGIPPGPDRVWPRCPRRTRRDHRAMGPVLLRDAARGKREPVKGRRP